MATLLITLTLGMSACGDDSGDGDKDAGGAGSGAGNGSAGHGGGGAGSGSTFSGKCGTTTCPTVALGDGCCTVEGSGVAGNMYELSARAPGLCGVDIGSVVPALAGVCLQLNQPGTDDSSCPTVNSGGGNEPGCCTDEGFCGTKNSSVMLGCHYAMSGKGKACGDNGDGGAADAGH